MAVQRTTEKGEKILQSLLFLEVATLGLLDLASQCLDDRPQAQNCCCGGCCTISHEEIIHGKDIREVVD